MRFLNLSLSIRISSSYYSIKGRYFDFLQRIIILSNLLNYSLLEGILIKAANKIIYKALRYFILFIKNFKYYYLPLLLKFNFALLIIAIALLFLYKVLGRRRGSSGNIKSAARYTILMVILIFLEQLLTTIILKPISILIDKALAPF